MRYINQQLFPAPAPSKSYHRRLLEVAVVGIVLGVVFLLFWQGVLRAPPTAEFVEDHCTSMLGRYVTDVASATFDIAEDGRLAACSVAGDAVNGLSVGWSGSYECNSTTVRYKAEENPNWLGLVVQAELPEQIYSNETLILDLRGLPRFSYVATVYNPAARATFDARLAELRSHSCEI